MRENVHPVVSRRMTETRGKREEMKNEGSSQPHRAVSRKSRILYADNFFSKFSEMASMKSSVYRYMPSLTFFSPWMQPAKSLVIFPESTVSTQACSRTLENLQRKNQEGNRSQLNTDQHLFHPNPQKKEYIKKKNTVCSGPARSVIFFFHIILHVFNLTQNNRSSENDEGMI